MIKSYKHVNKLYYFVQISFTHPSGKRKQKRFNVDESGNRFTSRRKAEEFKFQMTQKIKDRINSENKAPSFADYHQKFLKQIKLSFKRSTVMQYENSLLMWLNQDFLNKKLKDFTKSDIHEFIYEAMPKKKANPHTQKRILKYLRRIFEAALEDGIINKNPCKGISVQTPVTQKLVLNTEEANLLLEKARYYGHPFYHVWAMALLTGMRSGELYALRWADIDLSRGLISVHASWSNKNGYSTTKSNKCRIVPISEEMRMLLLELQNLGPFPEEVYNLSGKNQYFDDFVLQRLKEWRAGVQAITLKDFCKQIGITQIKFHDLRSTFITNLLSSGASAPHVMSIVGHERMATTDKYLRLAGVDIKGVTDKITYSLPRENAANVIQIGTSLALS